VIAKDPGQQQEFYDRAFASLTGGLGGAGPVPIAVECERYEDSGDARRFYWGVTNVYAVGIGLSDHSRVRSLPPLDRVIGKASAASTLRAVTVTYKARRVDISQINVVVESITYVISTSPTFSTITTQFFAWTGHGPDTGIRAPGGSQFHVDFGGACKVLDLAPGTYYIRADYFYKIGGGALQVLHGESETFNV
jgi:hypothetical protein